MHHLPVTHLDGQLLPPPHSGLLSPPPRVRRWCPEKRPDAPGRWSTQCPPRPRRVGHRSCTPLAWPGPPTKAHQPWRGVGIRSGSPLTGPLRRSGLAHGVGAGQSRARWPGSLHRKQRRSAPDPRRSSGGVRCGGHCQGCWGEVQAWKHSSPSSSCS